MHSDILIQSKNNLIFELKNRHPVSPAEALQCQTLFLFASSINEDIEFELIFEEENSLLALPKSRDKLSRVGY